jgi:hypothetical protein
MTAVGLRIDVGRPRDEARQEEEPVEHVLALADPGHGFYVQRVRGEDEADEGRAEEGGLRRSFVPSEEPPRKPHRESGVGAVQEDVGQVIAAGVALPERVVEPVGPQGRGVPVGVEEREGPARKLQVECAQVGVQEHVLPVVPVDELEGRRGPVQGHGESGSEKSGERHGETIGRKTPDLSSSGRWPRSGFAAVCEHALFVPMLRGSGCPIACAVSRS